MPDFAAIQAGYRNLWNRAEIVPAQLAAAKAAAAKIIAHKAVYQEIEVATGVPWFMVGGIHDRESDCDFTTYLGNGQSLNEVTTQVPRGRGPFSSFKLGAIDALTIEGYTQIKAWTPEHILYGAEEYNGWGYTLHNENSPYLWAATTLQQRGKYDADGHYDPNLWDTQLGFVAVLKAICLSDPVINAFMNRAAAPLAPAQPKEPSVATTPALPSLNVDWHLLLSGVENQLPTMIGSVPALAPFKDIITSGAKVLLHANPATVQGDALNLVIDQGLPLLAQFFPQISPFIGIASMLAKMLLHAAPPVAAAQSQPVNFQASTGAS